MNFFKRVDKANKKFEEQKINACFGTNGQIVLGQGVQAAIENDVLRTGDDVSRYLEEDEIVVCLLVAGKNIEIKV